MRSTFTKLFATVALGGGLALIAAGPAAAHNDTIDFAVSTDPTGRVIATATWSNDHDPVTDRIAATVVATSASGVEIGPLVLEPVSGKAGVLALAKRLDPGTWSVVVESAEPALGRGEATLSIKPAVSTVTAADVTPVEHLADPEPAWAVATVEVAILTLLASALGLLAQWLWRRRPTLARF